MPRQNESPAVTDIAMAPARETEIIPPASVVKDFAVELPGLIGSLPSQALSMGSELLGALSEILPHFADREAGG